MGEEENKSYDLPEYCRAWKESKQDSKVLTGYWSDLEKAHGQCSGGGYMHLILSCIPNNRAVLKQKAGETL